MNPIWRLVSNSWHLIFDGDDTLWDCSPVYQALDQQCLDIIQASWPAGTKVDREVLKTARHDCQVALHDRRGHSLDLYPNAWVQAYRWYAARHHVISRRDIEHALLVTASRFQTAQYPLFDEVVETLEELVDDGHELDMLTLGDDDLQRKKVRDNGLSRFFPPERIHVIQDTKGPIMRLISQHGPVGHVVMVGDSMKGDIIPALNLGLSAIWVKNNHPTWMPAKKSPPAGQMITISHLRDVPLALTVLHPRP